MGLDAPALVRASRLVAKVDSAAVQDGFDLYLHGFIVADDGAWVVVQQGMNGARRQARRYHWLWDRAGAFVEEPHAAIEGRPVGEIVNLTDRRASPARSEMLDLARREPETAVGSLAHLRMPDHHDVRAEDIDLRRLGKTLAAVADRGPEDFAELMLVPGVGARTLFALALVAEVIHGAPSRFADPARFSLAHGGKDGHPFPVPLNVYDETLGVLRRALDRAKLGEGDRLAAVRRLDDQARSLEGAAAVTEAELERGVEREWAAKASLGGRTRGRRRAPRAAGRASGVGRRRAPRAALAQLRARRRQALLSSLQLAQRAAVVVRDRAGVRVGVCRVGIEA